MAGKAFVCSVLYESSCFLASMYGVFLGSGKLALNCRSVGIPKSIQLMAKWENQEGAKGTKTIQLLPKKNLIIS